MVRQDDRSMEAVMPMPSGAGDTVMIAWPRGLPLAFLLSGFLWASMILPLAG